MAVQTDRQREHNSYLTKHLFAETLNYRINASDWCDSKSSKVTTIIIFPRSAYNLTLLRMSSQQYKINSAANA